MATLNDVLQKAFKAWYRAAAEYTKGVVKTDWLHGPRPSKLGVKSGNLRNRVDAKILPDGYAIGTNVAYGIYWEKGIKAHKVVAKAGKVLAIPMGLAAGVTKKGAAKMGILKTGKQKGLIFRKSVNIPAQAPRKWLEPGVRQATPMAMQIGHQEMLQVVKYFPNKTVGH
jgi:hypothetical protein